MGKIVVLVGSMRKGGNTDLLAQAFPFFSWSGNFAGAVRRH